MPTAEELHEQSHGFHPWGQTRMEDRAKWIKWAQRTSGAPVVDLPTGTHNNWHTIIQMGFVLGNSMALLCDPSLLAGWGGPEQPNFGGLVPVRLNAPVMQFMDPKYDQDGVSLTLSFDKLRRCKIRWEAIFQVVFVYDEPEPERKVG